MVYKRFKPQVSLITSGSIQSIRGSSMLKVRVNTALAALGVLPAIIGVQLLSSMLKTLFFEPAWPPEASLFLGISYVAFSLLILNILCFYLLMLSF